MAFQFDLNERVLCFHGPMLYDAKILKREENTERPHPSTGQVGPHYFVHYKGWKATYDEWLAIDRIKKYNEEGLSLQRELQQKFSATKSKKSESVGARRRDGGAASTAGGHGSAATRGTKRTRDEDDSTRKPDLKLTVPETLKLILVDDWEAITKNNQLLTVPRTPTVQQLLQDFEQHVLRLEKPPPHPQVLPHIISGLQTYFDRALGANLLYRFERPQYALIRKKYITGPDVKPGTEVDMSTVYGSEHFLRMLVAMPNMVASSTMDPESVAILREYIQELMSYMVQEKERIFQVTYEETDPPYQNISRS